MKRNSPTLQKTETPFNRTNYLIMLAGYLLIITGFCLLCGPVSTEEHFDPDIFDLQRTAIAPAVTLAGFITILVGICFQTDTHGKK